jgi:metal-responsive CopG/Arc/MetJ family transcriptional regulator
MPLPEGKKQVPITLPLEIIERVDQDAADNYTTRAGFLSRIIIDYYRARDKKEDSQS